MKNFFLVLVLSMFALFANAQTSFTMTANYNNVLNMNMKQIAKNDEVAVFKFNLLNKTLEFQAGENHWIETIVNAQTQITVIPVHISENDMSFELANAIHEIWTEGAYYQLYCTLSNPDVPYVIVEHAYVGSVYQRIYYQ
jgi:hypothetical protein